MCFIYNLNFSVSRRFILGDKLAFLSFVASGVWRKSGLGCPHFIFTVRRAASADSCFCSSHGCVVSQHKLQDTSEKGISCTCRSDAAPHSSQVLQKDERRCRYPGHALLWRRRCGAHGTPARGIRSILGGLHQENRYQRTTRAVDIKIEKLMTSGINFHDIFTLGVLSY